MNNRRGRPEKETEKRDQMVPVRFTKTERNVLDKEAESLGISVSDYMRSKVLNGKRHTLNGLALLATLDALGAELGRSGNNINQLAKHANAANKAGKVDGSIMDRFNVLFEDYIKSQQEIQTALRKIIREAKS